MSVFYSELIRLREVESEEIAAEGVQVREQEGAAREHGPASDDASPREQQAMDDRTSEDFLAEEVTHGWEEGGGNGLGGGDGDSNSLDD